MNILFGLLRADQGEILIGRKPTRLASPRAARRHAIGMVHQHFRLVTTFTAVENFRLFLPGSARRLMERAAAWREKLKWAVPLDVRIENLSVGQQQRVEILKARFYPWRKRDRGR